MGCGCVIDEKEGENLSVTWLGWVLQVERLDPVLEGVREDDEATFFAEYVAEILNGAADAVLNA